MPLPHTKNPRCITSTICAPLRLQSCFFRPPYLPSFSPHPLPPTSFSALMCRLYCLLSPFPVRIFSHSMQLFRPLLLLSPTRVLSPPLHPYSRPPLRRQPTNRLFLLPIPHAFDKQNKRGSDTVGAAGDTPPLSRAPLPHPFLPPLFHVKQHPGVPKEGLADL